VPEAGRPGADARTDIRCIHNSVDLSSRAAWVAWSAHLSVSAVTGRCVLVRTAAAACVRACVRVPTLSTTLPIGTSSHFFPLAH